MLKNLFRIPNTFASDDYRRKRILNILLVAFIGLAVLIIILTLLLRSCQCVPFDATLSPMVMAGVTIVINSILLIAKPFVKNSGLCKCGNFCHFP